MSEGARKLLLALGVGFGGGYGAYYLSQNSEIQKLEKDKHEIESLIERERKRIAGNQKAQSDQETRISELTKSSSEKQKAIKDMEIKLDAARKQVQQLEGQLKAKAEDAKKVGMALRHLRVELHARDFSGGACVGCWHKAKGNGHHASRRVSRPNGVLKGFPGTPPKRVHFSDTGFPLAPSGDNPGPTPSPAPLSWR